MSEGTDKDTETIRVVTFDGEDKTKWREWKLKTLAIGKVKKWNKAFLFDCDIVALEKKAEKDKEDVHKIKENDHAWTNLMMACKGKAFSIVTAVPNDDAFKA